MALNQNPSRILDKFAEILTSATGVAQGVKHEIHQAVRVQLECLIADMDLIRREDFDVVQEIACKVCEKNEMLEERVKCLEERLSELEKSKGCQS